MAICETCDYANRPPYKSPCSECDKTMGSPFCCYEHEEKPTNADRIRVMSDEEVAKWLVERTVYQESAFSQPSYLNYLTGSDDTMESAIKGTVEWLKQPAEE